MAEMKIKAIAPWFGSKRKLAPTIIRELGEHKSYPELNYPAFHDAAARLRAQGHEVLSPAELNPVPEKLNVCMANDLHAVCHCEVVALLPGWMGSKGVAVELALARYLGLKVICAVTMAVMLEGTVR